MEQQLNNVMQLVKGQILRVSIINEVGIHMSQRCMRRHDCLEFGG
jgi:hypothetical protein